MHEVAADAPLVSFATIGIDQVAHADRRGDTDEPPETLFFNAFNLPGARGNVLQGAADQFALVRLVETLAWEETTSPVADTAIRFDGTKIVFIGHSQGGTVGAPFVAYETNLAAAVLSGTGGGLVPGILGKTSPEPIVEGVVAALQANPKDLGEGHPVLSLLQTYFDSVDALNFAEGIFFRPAEGQPGKHVLQTYGLGDTFTPPSTMGAFGSAMRATAVSEVLEPIGGVRELAPPADSTWWTNGLPVTAAIVQAEPDGSYDGHFVLFRHPGIRKQLRHFLATLVTEGLPVVPAQ